MTGPWSPSISWPTASLGKIAEVQLGKMLQPEPSTDVDVLTPYIRAGSLGKLDSLGELPRMYASPRDRVLYGVGPRDLVVAEGGDVGRPEFVPQVPKDTIIQNSLHRVRPLAGIAECRFVKYALEAIYSGEWLEVLCNRSTFGHLTLGKVRSLPVPLPPLSYQRRVAKYLDIETARVDTLIAKKGRIAHLASERVGALLEDLVWDSSQREVSLNRLVAKFVDYRGATPEKSDLGIPLATAGHIKDGRLNLATDPQFVAPSVYDSWMRRGFPELGDVLMTMEAPLGEVAQVDRLPIALAQRVILMKPDTRLVSGEFLALLLRSPSFQGRLAAAATGSTALGIRADRMQALRLPLVPRDHQESAVKKVGDAESRLRELAVALESQVVLLRERRQALITAAVTGELEVPGVAA